MNTHEYIGAWVLDQKRSIARNATDITNKLIEMGYECKDDLKIMKDHTVLMTAIGLNYVEANALVTDDAMAIHQQLALPQPPDEDDRTILPEKKVEPYDAWTGKMEPSGSGSSICSEAELHRWLAALLYFIEAQSTPSSASSA